MAWLWLSRVEVCKRKARARIKEKMEKSTSSTQTDNINSQVACTQRSGKRRGETG